MRGWLMIKQRDMIILNEEQLKTLLLIQRKGCALTAISCEWRQSDKALMRLGDCVENATEPYWQELFGDTELEQRTNYNAELVSNFIDHYEEETGYKISESVFMSFFDA